MMDEANYWEIKEALKNCRQILEICQRQLSDLKTEVLLVHDDLDFDNIQHYRPHKFLKVPETPLTRNVEKDFLVIIETLKKYDVILTQMIREISDDMQENFRETLEDTKVKLRQLMETFVIVQTVIGNSNDTIDSGLPDLPIEINTAERRSARSIRDVLAVREYEKLLNDHIGNTLSLYEA